MLLDLLLGLLPWLLLGLPVGLMLPCEVTAMPKWMTIWEWKSLSRCKWTRTVTVAAELDRDRGLSLPACTLFEKLLASH